MSARKSSVKAIGMPMKMANSITSSIAMPSSSWSLTSYLELLAVLELAPEADLVAALQALGDALHHEQQRGERHGAAERPHDGAPVRHLRALAELVGIEHVVDADRE